MNTANLIEDAERWAKTVSESPGIGTAGEDLYGAKLLYDLAAALRASEERARKAEELAAANLAANKRIVELEQERDAAKRQISALENQLVNAAALRIEDEAHCERLIAERDAARAELEAERRKGCSHGH